MRISLSTAQRMALHCQGLNGGWEPPAGKEGVARTVERLGYVQIDTIAVVRRAHHHTFWVRRPDYEPQMLHELQAQDRRVFEWWAPAMSYVPMSDYRYYATRMGPDGIRRWRHKWYTENKDVVEGVLERIRQEGPLGSSNFKAPEGYKRGTWWSWKPAKEALEVLFDMGELMVTERRGFQRIYDLRERVLPASLDTSEPSLEEIERFRVRRTLGGLGFAAVDGIHWGRRWGPAAASEAVQGLIDAGEVTSFDVEGWEGTYCALTETLDAVAGHPGDGNTRTVHILSPFDNLVIRRGWLSRVFGFAYKLEAYTPAAKRKYGYFCLPVLWGTRFVGRMDAKAGRKAKTFIVRKLIFEPGFDDYEGLWPEFVPKLKALSAFAGCKQIAVEQTDPEMVREPFERALGSIQ
jgi:uncharacterized protein YcaQ